MDVYDHDESSDPDLIGSSETCVTQLRSAIDQEVFIKEHSNLSRVMPLTGTKSTIPLQANPGVPTF